MQIMLLLCPIKLISGLSNRKKCDKGFTELPQFYGGKNAKDANLAVSDKTLWTMLGMKNLEVFFSFF